MTQAGDGEFDLGEAAREAGYGLLVLDEAPSTNAVAWTRFREGEAGPAWTVARTQTAGRGRRGVAWSTPRGNLAASLLLTLDVPVAAAATLGFVAGVALATALEAFGLSRAATPVALKWPNDVVAGGAKLVGILLESEALDAGRSVVIVGIGVNVAAAPEGLPYPATSLRALGCEATAPDLFAALSDAWVRRFREWDTGRGLPSIRAAWLSRATGLGAPITVRTGSAVTRGVFETIDDGCALVLRRADGASVAVTAGEVHFGEAATVKA